MEATVEEEKKAVPEIFTLTPLDIIESYQEKMLENYEKMNRDLAGKSEMEAHAILQEIASGSMESHCDLIDGLLYGILVFPERAAADYGRMMFVTRDGFAHLIHRLKQISFAPKFYTIKDNARRQLFWLLNELIGLNIQEIYQVLLILTRQMRGGDISIANVKLCQYMLDFVRVNKEWVYQQPNLVPTLVYAFSRLALDHSKFIDLREQECEIVVMFIKEKFLECGVIGRDLVRALQDIGKLPRIKELWEEILKNPKGIHEQFEGVGQLLKVPTPKHFLMNRVTIEMEYKLMFIMERLRMQGFYKHLMWFIQQYLSTPESGSLLCDVIRYIVGVIHPTNQQLASDLVPRYVVLGALFRMVRSPVVAANCKLAFVYDLVFYNVEADNIMNIEPAALFIEKSMEKYSFMSAAIIEFIYYISESYSLELSQEIKKSIEGAVEDALKKGVISSLESIYEHGGISKCVKKEMLKLFPNILSAKMNVNDGLDNEKQPVEMDADKVYSLEDNNQGSQENEDGYGDGDGDDYSDGDGNGNGDGDGDNIYDLDKHLYDTQSVIDNQGYTGLNISYEVGDMGGMGDIGEPELYKINGSPEYNGGMYTDSGIEEQVEFTNESTGESMGSVEGEEGRGDEDEMAEGDEEEEEGEGAEANKELQELFGNSALWMFGEMFRQLYAAIVEERPPTESKELIQEITKIYMETQVSSEVIGKLLGRLMQLTELEDVEMNIEFESNQNDEAVEHDLLHEIFESIVAEIGITHRQSQQTKKDSERIYGDGDEDGGGGDGDGDGIRGEEYERVVELLAYMYIEFEDVVGYRWFMYNLLYLRHSEMYSRVIESVAAKTSQSQQEESKRQRQKELYEMDMERFKNNFEGLFYCNLDVIYSRFWRVMVGNYEILRLVVQMVLPYQLQRLVYWISTRKMSLYGVKDWEGKRNSGNGVEGKNRQIIEDVIMRTIEWEPNDQVNVWQLLLTEIKSFDNKMEQVGEEWMNKILQNGHISKNEDGGDGHEDGNGDRNEDVGQQEFVKELIRYFFPVEQQNGEETGMDLKEKVKDWTLHSEVVNGLYMILVSTRPDGEMVSLLTEYVKKKGDSNWFSVNINKCDTYFRYIPIMTLNSWVNSNKQVLKL